MIDRQKSNENIDRWKSKEKIDRWKVMIDRQMEK